MVTARISLPASRYPDDAELRAFPARLLERVRAFPGVRPAGITSNLPFGGDYSDSVILAEGYKMSPGAAKAAWAPSGWPSRPSRSSGWSRSS